MHRLIIVFLLATVAFTNVLAQEECAVKLREAEARYEEGLIEEVPDLLEECLESGFTAADELSAYKLLIRCLLFDDETEAAELAMLEFLKKYPEYEISPTDAADFKYLFNQHRVKNVIQLGLHGGGNITYILGKVPNSVASIPDDPDYSNDQMTLMLGVDIRYKLNEEFEIGTELDYSELSFKTTEVVNNFAQVNYSEKIRRLEVPVNIYYSPLKYGKLSLFAKGGIGTSLIITAEGTTLTENRDINNPIDIPAETENRIDNRKRFDCFINAGIGAKYKIPRGYIFTDVTTRIGVFRPLKPAEPSGPEFNNLKSDDLIGLNTVRFSIGYIFIIYKPEKIQEGL